MSLKISTSAVAHGRDQATVINDLIDKEVDGIELAIGPRPSPLAVTAIERAADEGIAMSAHANFVADKIYNQDRDFKEILKFCVDHGIDTYSIHAPRRKQHPTWNDFLKYLLPKANAALEMGINFGIETMYYTPDRRYWLDCFSHVHDLYSIAEAIGWKKFLIVDVAHLQICENFGTWQHSRINDLMKCDNVLELHFSDNNKIHDVHKVYVPGTNNQIDFWLSLVPKSTTFVDEGRRKDG